MDFLAFVAELVARGVPFRYNQCADGSGAFFVAFDRDSLWDTGFDFSEVPSANSDVRFPSLRDGELFVYSD